MGNCNSCSGSPTYKELGENPYEFQYDEDKAHLDKPHYDSIPCSVQSLIPTLKEAQEKLQQSKKLYKDPTQSTEPIVLKPVQGRGQIRCTYERPFRWLKDVKQPPYRIFKREGGSASEVTIADQNFQYFGVFLCYLAQHPELIQKVIVTGQNSYGLYAVEMIIDNQTQHIFIDDYVLCQEKRPLFSQPIQLTYIWPCLLEKAWLKVKGHMYKKIHKIQPRQVFESFFSFPMKTYTLSGQRSHDVDLMAEKIDTLTEYQGCIVTTKKIPQHKIGISGGGNYFLIRKFQYERKQYYYLRNPCGAFDFRGAHELKEDDELMKYVQKITGQRPTPGNFVLDEEEFIEQVGKFTVIHYGPQSQVASEMEFNLPPNEERYALMRVQKDCELSLNYRQASVGPNQQYSPVTFHVIHTTHDEVISDLNNEEGCFGNYSTNMLEGVSRIVRRGEYLIRIKKKQGQPASNNGRSNHTDKIVALGSEEVRITSEPIEKGRQTFEKFLCERGRRSIEGKKSEREDIAHHGFWLGDLAVIYVEKTNPILKKIRLEVSFKELLNLQCLNQPVGKGYTSLKEFPSDLLIIFEKIDLAEETNLGHYSLDSY